MPSRLLALTITAVVALGVAGSASAGGPALLPYYWGKDGGSANVTGTWDTTHTYGVNGTTRTCTLTRGAKCVGAKLRGKVKHHGDLRKANLRRADLRFADLRGANLKGAKFQYAAPVHGKKAKRANQTPSCAPNCAGADLQGADMMNANLMRANLANANLVGAILEDANLISANLINANLVDANLTGADLLHADLMDADLVSTDLRTANLTGANLAAANLLAANLTQATLVAVVWSNTTCPDGTVTSTGCPN